ANGDHTQRFERLGVLYGAKSDPGVEVVIAQRPEIVSSFVPTAAEREVGSGLWNPEETSLAELVPTASSLALHDLVHFEGLPAMMVQLTSFACGGLAISIKLAHPLADAQSLMGFAHNWAAINRALITNEPLPSLCPIFEPEQLDRAASGNIDASNPDPKLIEAARNLPLHRYDCWASLDGSPSFMAQLTKIPSELDSNTIILGKSLSWSEWDLTAPVSHYLVSFTVDEIKNMWEDASSNSEIRISRLDALLAHIWMLIIRARELSHDQQPIYLDVTLGLRSRLDPPLSENFVGSPIILGNVSTIGIQSIGKMALSIRSTLSKFNSSSIGPMLHELAFELSPNRLWNAFLGRRNTIVTSWLHLKTYEVDFGIGVPRFVNALMPSVDGCVHLLENGNTKGAEKINRHLINVILLGLAFMLLYTAFHATTMLAQSVFEGIKNETINGTNFEGGGYISLGIASACMAIANIFAPVIISILGPSISMFMGGTTFLLYVLSFLFPMIWSFYLVSILLGIGAAILWTAQGTYLALYSNEMTVSRNAGIFWALLQIGYLPGNLFVYLSINTETITRSTRYPLFAVFSIVCAVGLAFFALIIWRTFIERRQSNSQLSNKEEKITMANIAETLKIAVRLFKTRNMLLLLISFAYTDDSLIFTGTRKRLIGLHGVLLGVGEILGGGLFGFITKPKTSSQRGLIIFIGFVLQIVFYYSVFINFPFDSPAKETNSKPYFEFDSLISQVIAFVGSFLVGLGDSSLNIQVPFIRIVCFL
ncbi:unnamed protein product, partial [Adineta steineri]